MRRGIVALAVVASLLASVPGGAASALRWQLGAHLRGVFDVVGRRADGRLIVAASGGLYLVDASGSSARLDPGYVPQPGGEPYVAVSPGVRDDAARCSFPRGAIAALHLAPAPAVTLIAPSGKVARLASVSGVTSLFGVSFDTVGRFDHRVLVVGRTPDHRTRVAAIDCRGRAQTIGTVDVPLEGGIAVAPSSFGAFAGDLIAPNELDGSIYAVAPGGGLRLVARSRLPAGQDVGVESLGFVPPAGAGATYLADRSTPGGRHPGDDRILELGGAVLRAAGVRAGDLLGATEGGATVVRVRCALSCAVVTLVATPTAAHGEGSLLVTSPV